MLRIIYLSAFDILTTTWHFVRRCVLKARGAVYALVTSAESLDIFLKLRSSNYTWKRWLNMQSLFLSSSMSVPSRKCWWLWGKTTGNVFLYSSVLPLAAAASLVFIGRFDSATVSQHNNNKCVWLAANRQQKYWPNTQEKLIFWKDFSRQRDWSVGAYYKVDFQLYLFRRLLCFASNILLKATVHQLHFLFTMLNLKPEHRQTGLFSH